MTTTKTLLTAILATLIVCTTAAAEDTLRTSRENGKERIDFTLNGTASCVLIGERISCTPVAKSVQMASAETN